MASEHKPTLQLRHQICGNGITITASAYDTRRHHLLVYDALAQGVTAHTLRLFSLRREIRMTPLFDNENKPLHSDIRQEHSKATVTTEEIATTTITYISLVYSYENDVFVCMYNAFTKPPAPAKGVKKPAAMVVARYNVLFLEPATLKKLVTYPGPMTHDLRCAHFDEASSRLLLASRLRADQVHSRGSVRLLATTGDKSNAIDILHVSKRPFRTSTASTEARIMLCVEKTRQSIAYAEALVCMTATANLQVVYGTGICEYEDEEGGINERPRDSFVLEWRSNEENQLQLMRRIVHADDPITSMTVAEEGRWLFTGHESGQLRVWNMRSENTPSSSWTSTGGRHDSAVSTIQLQSVQGQRNEGCVEVVLFTTERRYGGVRHWQFIASTSVSGPPAVRFECVDALDVAPSDRNSNSPKKISKKQQLLVDQRRIALLLCVSIDMGTFAEKLVLVTRGDMIHVIKVQALLKIVHRVLGEDQVVFMRVHKSEADVSARLLCVRGSQVYGTTTAVVRNEDLTLERRSDFALTAPPPHRSARLTSIEICQASSTPLVAYGWSSGVVEVYNAIEQRRLLLLQDPRLNAEVSAIAIVVDPHEVCRNSTNVISMSKESSSWGGLVKATNVFSPTRIVVIAGSSCGEMYAWKVAIHRGSSTCQFVLEASIRLLDPAAHSTHVVSIKQLHLLSVLSVSADGMLKLWSLPTMAMISYLNAASATRIGMCSCLGILKDYGNEGEDVVVGYEDGMVGAWRVNQDGSRFTELTVGSHHERRVTRFCQVETTSGDVEFLSASLDTMIILWRVSGDGVQELRYFELGQPIVDCSVLCERVFVAFSQELCWFACREEAKKHDVPEREELNPVLADHTPELDESTEITVTKGEDSVEPLLTSTPRHEGASLTPTTHESEGGVINIPSVTIPETPVTLSFDTLSTVTTFQTRVGATNSSMIEGWQTDSSKEEPVDGEVLTVYLQQYIQTHGVNDTLAVGELSHFLSLHHLPLARRPANALAVYLQIHQIDPSMRLTLDEARSTLQELQQRGLGGDGIDLAQPGQLSRAKSMKKKQAAVKKRRRQEHDLLNRVPIVSYNILGEKTIKWAKAAPTKATNQEPSPHRDPTDVGNSNDVRKRTSKSKSRRHRPSPPVKELMQSTSLDFPDEGLVQRIQISQSFAPLWSNGYCWCAGLSVIVQWDDSETQPQVCEHCRHHRHTLRLLRNDYKPHFTLRMILEVIVDVYESLLPEANAILFNNDAGALPTERLSIHHALFQLFKHRYGIQSIVETKLKLLFVSMCHVVRQVDGVAVFGELLALFARTDVDEQAPDHIVALCVCAYGWLYSREMVANGLTLLGRSGGESENVHTSKATHWQFVRLANALFCAQELLRYPLVSPLYLHNIMRFAQDYSQRYPSRPDELTDEIDEGEANPMTRWLEMHRFLRMLVGEWKQQTTAFRSVEQLLFVAPLSSLKSEALTSILESLRLILSCFVFHDHHRAGVIPVHDFAAMLRRLKYLWPNEHLTEQEATRSTRYHDSLTFENAIFAAQKRFRDTERDGRLCYLDFWAMLYIVGVKTASLLKFREIPSFCKDYKLEISPELRDNVVTYMKCASSLLLPRGFQPARSSVTEEAKAKHRRRVGGLHDGMFAMDRTLATRTLSVQELLECHGDKTDDSNDLNRAGRMYVDGSLPALRKNASTSVLDASSVAIVKQTRTSPVVVGIRPSGPHPKPVALISASALENDDLPQSDKSSSRVYVHNPISQPSQTDLPVSTQDANALSHSEMSSSSFGNIYIQFPYISPRHTRVECLSMTDVQQRIIGTPTIDEDDETRSWKQHILSEHDAAEAEAERRRLEREQRASATLAETDAARVATKTMATRLHSFSKLVHSPSSTSLSPAKEATSPARSPKEKSLPDEAVAPVLALPATQMGMKSGRKTQREEAVVVIPTIEKESPIGLMSTAQQSPVRERTPMSVINNHEVIRHLERPEAASTEDDAFVHDDLQDWSMGGFDGDEALSPAPFEDEAHLEMTTEITQASVASHANSTPKDCVEDARLEAALSYVETVEPKLGVEVKVVATPVAQEAVKALQNVTLVEPVPHSSVVVVPTVQVPKTQSIDVLESLVNKIHAHETTRVLDVRAEEKNTASVVIAPAIDLPITKSEPQQAVVVANFQPAPIPTAKPSPPKVTAMPSKKVASIQPETPAVAKSSQRHQFKFSQQPQFQSSAAVNTNPLRARGWSPGDDSASDEEDDYNDEHHRRRRARTRTCARGNEEDEDDDYDEADDDSIAVEDMQLRLSLKSIASLRRRYNSDPNYQRTKMRPLGAFSPSFTSGAGSVSGEESSTEQRGTHLDNDTERALYGEHMTNDLGEGIVFSPEAEKAMQEKWNSIFSQAETTMFSPLKAQIESREAALREQEEQQSRLMKKRLEQQAQDDLRLRRNSILTTANGMGGGNEDPCAPGDTSVNNFRVRRLTREVCFQGQHELQYGTTARGDLKHVHNAQYYHFSYSPDTHGSILTLRLHVTCGEAEMFVSTETKAPCSSDFMWRSSLAPTISTDPNELRPGQKIVLFPHDLARVLSDAATEGTTSVTFFVSVIALEPRTSFMIGLMASGQTPEASRAVQMVDSLIERFNQLAHSFQSTPSESDRGVALTRRASGLTPSRRISRLKARLAELHQDTDNEQGDDDDDDASDVKVSTAPSQRNRDQHEEVDEEVETTSFQQLLESMSKRNSVDQDRNAAHSTPWSSQVETSTAREFLEDEVQRLQDTKARLSPVKMQTVVALATSSTDVDGVTDAIAAVSHRRLSSGSRRRLARLQQPLSPLKAKAQRAHQQEDGQSASLKVAMYEPKRVAYSLSSLRPREKR